MISRCENPKDIGFHRYGGRGIAVCSQWHSPEVFLADMGEPPTDEHSIERRDNDGPYAPENCYWGTQYDQHRNFSSNHWLTRSDGTRLILTDWARKIGISAAALQSRINGGWPLDLALTAPKGSKKPTPDERMVYHSDGRGMSLSDWAAFSGIDLGAIWQRIHVQGWSLEEAISSPLRKFKPKG